MFSLLLAASLAGTAQAQDYALTWPDEADYQVSTLLAFPRGFTFYATENVEGRVLQFGLVADLDCSSTADGKSREVVCELDNVLMEGQPMRGDEEQVPKVMAEFGALLSESRVEFEVLADGRIRAFDLEGFPKGTNRENDLWEILRQVLRRSLSPFDVQPPKDGIAPAKPWKHKGMPMGFELLTKTGTTGGVVIKYQPADDIAGRKVILGEGRGNVSTNAEADAGGQGAVNMVGFTRTLIDPSTHDLAYSELVVSGILSARAAAGAVSQAVHYELRSAVSRVNADGTVETGEGPVAPEAGE